MQDKNLDLSTSTFWIILEAQTPRQCAPESFSLDPCMTYTSLSPESYVYSEKKMICVTLFLMP